MMYTQLRTIAQMSCISESVSKQPEYDISNINTIEEAAAFIRNYRWPVDLDEAFRGKSIAKPIEDAMQKCVNAVKEDPNVWLRTHPANAELGKAISKVFGFKKCTIYWTDPSKGGWTLPASFITNARAKKSVTAGWKSGSYYDQEHVLVVVIEMDQRYISKCEMTAAELTGIVLHEIGHNFDFSKWVIGSTVWKILEPLLWNLKTSADYSNATATIFGEENRDNSLFMKSLALSGKQVVMGTLAGTNIGKQIIMEIETIWSTIVGIMPNPIREVIKKVLHTVDDVWSLLNSILSPLAIVGSAMQVVNIANVALMGSLPITFLLQQGGKFIGNFMTFKGEQFADSFATSYGYGPEMINGLVKLQSRHAEAKWPWAQGPIANIFYSMNSIYSETVRMVSREHGSHMQRAVYATRYLNAELKRADLSADERANINAELTRMMDQINTMTRAKPDDMRTLEKSFNLLVYNGLKGLSNLTPENYVK